MLMPCKEEGSHAESHNHRKFETPRETELLRFIDENGGIQACLASDKLMSELQKREGGKRQDIDGYRKRIKKEAEEDVDEVLRKNFDLFSRKLDLQSQQLNDIDETIRAQGEKMMSVFLAGSHDDILHRVGSIAIRLGSYY